jgi:hypothetical protein
MEAEAAQDAIELLEAGHHCCDQLFADYRILARGRAPAAARKALAERICLELTVHGKLEEELFYPAAREALQDDDLVDEAESAHDSARDLVGQVLAMRASHPLYDARVAVLAECVGRHVAHERKRVFPRLRRSALDLRALARSLRVRERELREVAEALREDALASVAG